MKRPAFLILLCLVALIPVSVVLAQTFLASVPVSVDIVPGVSEVTVYSDPQHTVEMTSMSLGSIVRGEEKTVYFYLVNSGDESLNILFQTTNVSDWGSVSFGPEIPFFIDRGNSVACWMNVSVLQSAEVGPKAFTLEILTE